MRTSGLSLSRGLATDGGRPQSSISSRTESRMLCPHGNDSLPPAGFCCGLFAGCLPSPGYGPGASAPDPASLTAGSPPWSQPACTRPGQAPGAQLAPSWHHCPLSRLLPAVPTHVSLEMWAPSPQPSSLVPSLPTSAPGNRSSDASSGLRDEGPTLR